MDRRKFVRLGAGAVAGTAAVRGKPLPAETLSGGETAEVARGGARFSVAPFALEEATIADLQAGMAAGRMTARSITKLYLDRITALDRKGPTLRHVLETNPDALAIADSLDKERKAGKVRGPLHGIPILLKDNIDTADRMTTTAGSWALAGSIPLQDAFIAAKLRAAGAILLGKTNLSEWANFRSSHSSSGWSGGGQAKNPYVLDRNPAAQRDLAVERSGESLALAIGHDRLPIVRKWSSGHRTHAGPPAGDLGTRGAGANDRHRGGKLGECPCLLVPDHTPAERGPRNRQWHQTGGQQDCPGRDLLAAHRHRAGSSQRCLALDQVDLVLLEQRKRRRSGSRPPSRVARRRRRSRPRARRP